MKALGVILAFVAASAIGVIAILSSPLKASPWAIAWCLAWVVVASKLVVVALALRRDRQQR